jgi:4-amino-4-deoxy-L-arabinose transferase-like glycosyltransferase
VRTSPDIDERRFLVAATAIVLLSLALRLAWLAYVPGGLSSQPLPELADRGSAYERLLIERLTDDQAFYARSAQYLAEGRGYREPFTESVTARWAPGYPFVLAATYKLAGADLLGPRIANALFGAIATGLTVAIGARVSSRGVALAAGGAYALFPAPIFMTSLIMTEPAFTAGLLAVVWLALRAAADGGVFRPLALGVVLGGIALLRPEAVLLVAAFAVFWRRRGLPLRRTAAASLAVMAGALIVLAPWTIRNAVTLDAFVPLSTGSGGALIQGHHRDANGALNQAIYDELRARYAQLPEPERQVAENRAGVRESIEFALKHPLEEAMLVPRKLYYLYSVDPGGRTWAQLVRWGVERQGPLEALGNAYYLGLLLLAAAGAVTLGKAWRSPGWALLGGTIVVWSTVYGFIYVGDGRYHAPLLPLFAILAAAGVQRAFFERQEEADLGFASGSSPV